jgi:hypothetical protein
MLSTKEKEEKEYEYVEVRENFPTRLRSLRDLLRALYPNWSNNIDDIIIAYTFNEVGLAVEFFDALRIADLSSLQWLFTHVSIQPNCLSAVEYESMVSGEVRKEVERRQFVVGENDLANYDKSARQTIVPDTVDIRLGHRHVRTTFDAIAYALAAARSRDIPQMMNYLDKKGISIRSYMERHRVKFETDFLHEILLEEMPELTNQIPVIYAPLGNNPDADGRRTVDKIRSVRHIDLKSSKDSIPTIYSWDTINMWCDTMRQLTPKHRVSLLMACHTHSYYEDLRDTLAVKIKEIQTPCDYSDEAYQKSRSEADDVIRSGKEPSQILMVGYLDVFGFHDRRLNHLTESYHLGTDWQTKAEALQMQKGILYRINNNNQRDNLQVLSNIPKHKRHRRRRYRTKEEGFRKTRERQARRKEACLFSTSKTC